MPATLKNCALTGRRWAIAVIIVGLQSRTPATAQCVPLEPLSGFYQERIGGEVTGSAGFSAARGLIEICSLSGGYGRTTDSLLGLVQDTSDEFELSVDVMGIDGPGQAGLEARVFRGTGSDPAQAVVKISVEEDAAGLGFAVSSGVRSQKFAVLETGGSIPVQVQLPVRIGIEGDGSQITTYFLLGPAQARVDHLTVPVQAGSGLDVAVYRLAMVHGASITGRPGMGTGRFRNPELLREQSVRPPRLSRWVENFQGTVDQPTTLTLGGVGLADTQEVTVAGVDAVIVEQTESRLAVQVPATGKPSRGDIVVRTSGGTSVLPNAFFSFGKSFVRCDCDGDGVVTVTDAIQKLRHLFQRGQPCKCAEAEDCNDDDSVNVSDAVFALLFLFSPVHGAPPHPYPNPGTDPTVPMCGLEDQLPAMVDISVDTIREGEVFEITGTGFSDRTRVVIPGARVEVLSRAPDRIRVRAGVVAHGGTVFASLIEDFEPVPSLCRPNSCSLTSIGPIDKLDQPLELDPSDVPVIGQSSQFDECSPIVIQLDREAFDPARPLEIIACLEAPSIANVTPGGRATSFTMSPRKTFEETLVALADRLRLELAGGGVLREVFVVPEREAGQVVLLPLKNTPIAHEAVAPAFPVVADISVLVGSDGLCGASQIHPVTDEREHGWCRLEELVEPCNGLPGFEWFIPLEFVTSKSSSLAGVPHPWDRAPHDKEIMFNWEAYCHVRRHRLWNLCTLERLVELGRTDIPDFPIGAWVTKTIWRSDDEIPAGIDKTKLYSYVYTGDGKTYYLTAIHHTTKDLDRWFWYDLYPAMEILEGAKGEFVRGIGGCGGTNVDAPAWTVDTIWANYFLCTNVTRAQPLGTSGVGGVGPTSTENSAWCGNFEFATECPDVIDAANLEPEDDCFSGDDTCLNCHADGAVANVGGSTIGVDFMHSLKSAQADPDPCKPIDLDDVKFSTHIVPIVDNSCSCHGYWSGGLAYAGWVNVPADGLTSMARVEPGDPANSYVWHKINNTHLTVGGIGCAMPKDCTATPTLLSPTTLATIEAWILAGAPDN